MIGQHRNRPSVFMYSNMRAVFLNVAQVVYQHISIELSAGLVRRIA